MERVPGGKVRMKDLRHLWMLPPIWNFMISKRNQNPIKEVFLEKPLKVKKSTPEEMVELVYKTAVQQIKSGKLPTYFGGEHSVSIGVLRAFAQKYKNLTVVQLDAHTDLRQEYMGTKFNHACALAEAQKYTNLIQVGIRSMDISEKIPPKGKGLFCSSYYGQ